MSITDNIREAKRYREMLESQAETKTSEMTLEELEAFLKEKEE